VFEISVLLAEACILVNFAQVEDKNKAREQAELYLHIQRFRICLGRDLVAVTTAAS
jgi:hypothetical protein